MERLSTFREHVERAYSILVCRACGSTLVDMYSIDTLGCANCGARVKLSKKLFHVVRCNSKGKAPAGMGVGDIVTIFERLKAPTTRIPKRKK